MVPVLIGSNVVDLALFGLWLAIATHGRAQDINPHIKTSWLFGPYLRANPGPASRCGYATDYAQWFGQEQYLWQWHQGCTLRMHVWASFPKPTR